MLYVRPRMRTAPIGATRPCDAMRATHAPPTTGASSAAGRPLWDGCSWGRDEELSYRDALRNLGVAAVREPVAESAAAAGGAASDEAASNLAGETLLALWRAQPRDDRLLDELSSGWGEVEQLVAAAGGSAAYEQR